MRTSKLAAGLAYGALWRTPEGFVQDQRQRWYFAEIDAVSVLAAGGNQGPEAFSVWCQP